MYSVAHDLHPLPPEIGPVRSARPCFLAWTGAFQPFFKHCVESSQALILLEDPDSIIGTELPYRVEEGKLTPASADQCSRCQFRPVTGKPSFSICPAWRHFRACGRLSPALSAGECESNDCSRIGIPQVSRRFLLVSDVKKPQSIPALTDTSKASKAGKYSTNCQGRCT